MSNDTTNNAYNKANIFLINSIIKPPLGKVYISSCTFNLPYAGIVSSGILDNEICISFSNLIEPLIIVSGFIIMAVLDICVVIV